MNAARPWLRIEEIELDVQLSGKRAVLEELARLLAARLGAKRSLVFDALWHRESLGSTALGRGMALPHARLPNLPSAVGAFVRLQQPVAFDAPDDKPVSFALALLLSQRDPTRQLNLLAAIATKFSDACFREEVADATEASAMCRLLAAGITP